MNIELMKAKVLDLAIRGRLTEQSPDEALSPEVLQLPEVNGPFEIPENWRFCRLNDIGLFFSGKTPAKDDISDHGVIPYFKVSDMNTKGNEKFLKEVSLFIRENAGIKTCPAPSIVYPKNGGAIFTNKKRVLLKPAVVDLNTGGYCPEPDFLFDYAFFYFSQIDFKTLKKGSVLPTLDMTKFKNMLVPLPPLAEQRRIVQKAEELFKIIDALQEHQDSLLEKLNLIRRTALDKAIRGQLTEQHADESLSPEVLQLPELNGPFELPVNWKWVKVKDLLLKHLGGGTPSRHVPEYWNGPIPWASVKDLKGIRLVRTAESITVSGLANSPSNLIPAGSLIVCMRMALGKILKTAVDVAINQDLRAIFLKNELISDDYFINFYQTLTFVGRGSTVKGITVDDLLNIKVPLPPLAEQKRIAAKLESMFSAVSMVEQLLQNTAAEFVKDAA